jgi:hypothetical protein
MYYFFIYRVYGNDDWRLETARKSFRNEEYRETAATSPLPVSYLVVYSVFYAKNN